MTIDELRAEKRDAEWEAECARVTALVLAGIPHASSDRMRGYTASVVRAAFYKMLGDGYVKGKEPEL